MATITEEQQNAATVANKWAHLQVDVSSADGNENVVTTPQIRRPYQQRHMRIHPTWVVPHIPLLRDERDYNQVYVLTPEILAMLPVGDRKHATIYMAVTSDDIAFFHFRMETSNEENIWAKTASNIIALGQAGWIRVTTSPGGGYDIHHPTDPVFLAKKPCWPADIDRAFEIALNGATGDGGQLITSPKHRVIVSLLRKAQL